VIQEFRSSGVAEWIYGFAFFLALNSATPELLQLLNSWFIHPRNNAPSLTPIDREAAAIVNPRKTMAQTPSAAAR
jgi:hypothetical protein